MIIEAFTAAELEDRFQFACHRSIACFNHCCRDLNQALTPYDVLRLRRRLEITSGEFLLRYAREHIGPETGLPIVSLRFEDDPQRACPFVTDAGCRVYEARPASCRLYPLARAVRRSRSDGHTSIHYAILQEAHCRGFAESRTQTVQAWIDAQDLATDFEMNDALMELIALKNRLRPGPLSAEHRQWLRTVLYDLDLFRRRVAAGERMPLAGEPHPDSDDDLDWLKWALHWVRLNLFGRAH